jgi:predicted RND superfamily exporter protein
MRLFFFPIIVVVFVLLASALLVSAGAGISYALRWIWPGIDFGLGILIGVVASAIGFYFFIQVYKLLNMIPIENLGQSEEEEEEEEEAMRAFLRTQLQPHRSKKRRRR